MYLEGYEDEGLLKRNDDPQAEDLVNSESHTSGSTTITDNTYERVFDGSPGEIAGFGIPGLTETTI